MKVLVRPATEADLPAILALYAQPGFDDGQVLDLAQARRIFAEFARYPDYVCHVAQSEADGQVVGSYALMVMHNLAHCGAPSAIVEDVVVARAAQGQGIGRVMMQHAMDRARKSGCYKLALSANRMRVKALRFYESLGFSQHGMSFVMEL